MLLNRIIESSTYESAFFIINPMSRNAAYLDLLITFLLKLTINEFIQDLLQLPIFLQLYRAVISVGHLKLQYTPYYF